VLVLFAVTAKYLYYLC